MDGVTKMIFWYNTYPNLDNTFCLGIWNIIIIIILRKNISSFY